MFCLSLGSVLALIFIVQLLTGKKYNAYVSALASGDFPLKSLYAVGFAWSCMGLFKLKGKNKETLLSQAKLLYNVQYAEFYANTVWAQVLMITHLFVCFGFLLAGAANFVFFAIVGVVFGLVMANFFYSVMKNKLSERQINCLIELPEIVSSMALLINSGMMLREAWEMIASSKKGIVYGLMQDAGVDMKNGVSDTDAIYKFGIMTNTPEVKKFSSALIQGIELGPRDLSIFLSNQSSEMWNLKKQIMLQKGEVAASKLMVPISLTFVGILIIVISSAFGMM
jgi:tight adherence protein C